MSNDTNTVIYAACKALEYLADNPRPSGGNDVYNTEHLLQLAGELKATLLKAEAVEEYTCGQCGTTFQADRRTSCACFKVDVEGMARELEQQGREDREMLGLPKASMMTKAHNDVHAMASAQMAEDQLHAAQAKIERQAERIRYLEGATNHAEGTPLSKALQELNVARRERDHYLTENNSAREELKAMERDYVLLASRLDGHTARECRMNLDKLLEDRETLVKGLEAAQSAGTCFAIQRDILADALDRIRGAAPLSEVAVIARGALATMHARKA